MYDRLLERKAEEALSDTPVVLIVGPRRAGKTILIRKIGGTDSTYITLDDRTTLDAAQSDPAGLVRRLNKATIDEIQCGQVLLYSASGPTERARATAGPTGRHRAAKIASTVR